jgi:hypothetical protein
LALIAIYMRNLLLNQTLMAAAVAAIIAGAQMLAPSILWANPLSGCVFCLVVGVAVVGAIIAAVCIGRCLGCLARNQNPQEPKKGSLWARIAAVVTATAIWLLVPTALIRSGTWPLLLGSAALLMMACLVAFLVSRNTEGSHPALQPVNRDLAAFFGFLSSFAAGAFFLLLVYGFVHWLQGPKPVYVGDTYAALGLPAILVSLALTSYVHMGIFGNSFPDAKREWLGRLAGYFLFFAAIAALVLVIALWGPLLMHLLFGAAGTSASGTKWLKWIVPGGWLFTVLSGLFAAKSPSTGPPGGKSKFDLLAKIAPPVFLIGVLLLVS